MADLPQVSENQEKQTKNDEERKRYALQQEHVSSEHPNPLVESRTVRNPLVPQPEPDADPMQPLTSRPSRSRNSENDADGVAVEETRTGSEDTADTQAKAGKPLPQPGPEVVSPEPAERDELGRVKTDDELEREQKAQAKTNRKRVAAGKKAAETRAKNQAKAKK